MTSPVLRILAVYLFLSSAAHAQNLVVGVNVVNPMRANVADQNAVLAQLQGVQVRVIRCGIRNDDKGIDFWFTYWRWLAVV